MAWEVKTISDICNVEYGTRVVRKRDGGSVYPVYGGGGATFFMDEFNREDCLIVSRFAMSELCTRFVKGKFFLNDSGLSLKPKSKNEIYQIFLNYQILYLNDYIYSLGRGTAQRNLDVKNFREIKINYPKSLQEQKRIVKILDETFEKLEKIKENTQKNLKSAKEIFESELNNIFENPKEDWEEKELGEIGKISMCKRILKNQTTTNGEIPFYKIGTFGKIADAYISKELYNNFRNKFSFPKKGDVLISASGTIGRRVVFDDKPAYFQDSNIVWIDNNENYVLNSFLYYFYGCCNWNSKKGATISRLYNYNLKEMVIKFPTSIQQQTQIVEKLNKLQEKTKKLEGIYQKKLNNIEELKKSILQKAFKEGGL